MHIEFLVENIQKYISILSKIIPTHSQIPALSNILLKVDKASFYIGATNLELGVQIKIPAKIEKIGSTTIPGKQFIEVVNALVSDKIRLIQEGESLTLTNKENKVSFQTINPEEFPNLFEERGGKIYSFRQKEFKDIFLKLIFATSLSEARPELTGAFLLQGKDFIDFVATDGFRLSLIRLKGKKLIEGDEGVILSGRIIGEALSVKDEGDIILYLNKDKNQILLETENIKLIGRLIHGDFPNYEKVIPQDFKTRIIVDKDEFLQIVKFASILARDNSNIVKLKIIDNSLYVFSKSAGIGNSEAKVDVEQTGDDNEISFNAKFLLDLLRNIESRTLVLEMNSNQEPAAFRIEKNEDFLHIIMPVRVQE